MKMKFLYAGIYNSDKAWRSGNHSHDFFEFIGVQGGKARVEYRGKAYDVKDSSILVYEPGVKHSEVSTEASPLKFSYLGVVLGVVLKTRGRSHTPLFKSDGLMVIDSPRKAKAGLGIIAEIYRESETRELGWRQVIDANIYRFLRLMAQDCRRAGDTAAAAAPAGLLRRRQIVEKVKTYIQSHSTGKVSIDDLTKVAYLSPYYLSRMFKSETGFSPIQYLINTKIKAAKALLGDPELTISQIAQELGYESIHYFSRLFTAVEGVSPSLYRAKLLKGK